MKQTTPICPYCSKPAVLFEDSRQFYRGTDFGAVWACVPCAAWVGCHKNSRHHAPLGRLANEELRKAKILAHAHFDPLWQAKWRKFGSGKGNKGRARSAAYQWLAGQLGIAPKDCHIGMFDVDLCRRVVEACKPFLKTRRAA